MEGNEVDDGSKMKKEEEKEERHDDYDQHAVRGECSGSAGPDTQCLVQPLVCGSLRR
jgi:hypothetical protein